LMPALADGKPIPSIEGMGEGRVSDA
jgi:hypothetical protein